MENACWVVTIPHLHMENNIWNCLAVIPGFTWASSSSKCSPAIFLPGFPVHCLCRSLTLDDRCAIIGCRVQNIYHDQSFSWFFCMRWQCLNQPSWALMSLPIRYSPMVFYFRLSIIFLTPQVLQHLLRWRDLLQPSHDHHRLYPIPIAPLVWYHVGDLPYDLWTTLLHFPFLVFSPYPTHSFVVRPITGRRTTWLGPYHTLRRTQTLCSFYLSFVYKTFVSTPKNKEVFPRTQT